jgi:hypothetical protein
MAQYTLHKKFIDGLYRKYEMEPADLNGWWYIGGEKKDSDDEYDAEVTTDSYFDLVKKTNPRLIKKLSPLPRSKECVCCHAIHYNHWITDGEKVLVIGRCCKKQFLPDGCASGRNCDICHDPHKNRKVNRCNDCRIGLCDICGKTINPIYKTCWQHRFL